MSDVGDKENHLASAECVTGDGRKTGLLFDEARAVKGALDATVVGGRENNLHNATILPNPKTMSKHISIYLHPSSSPWFYEHKRT